MLNIWRCSVTTAPVSFQPNVGDRILYTALFNNPGHEKPGEKIPGMVITVFGEPPVYRIELDTVWKERMIYASGKKIVVGNVRIRQLSPLIG
jgi:hypothetical protein